MSPLLDYLFGNTRRSILFTMLVVAIILLLAQWASADQSGSIGVTVNKVIDDRSGGLIGDYTYTRGNFTFAADGQAQVGDAYRGKVHTEFLYDFGWIGAKLILDNTVKGQTLDDLGRNQTVAFAANIEPAGLPVDIGIGGNNASPWAAASGLDILVPKGFNRDELEALGLGDIYPDPRGLPFQEGSRLQAFIATEIDWQNITTDLKAILDLTGEEKANQYHIGVQTGSKLWIFNITARYELGIMAMGGQIYHESAYSMSTGFRF